MKTVSKENRNEVASRILQSWGLEPNQRKQLLDDKETVLAVLDMYQSLTSIYSGAGEERAAAWPGRPNREFEGRTAIQVMLDGDVESVRKYLKYHAYNGY